METCTIWWRTQSLLLVTLTLPIHEYSLNYHQAFVDKRKPYISWVNHFLFSNLFQLRLSLCLYLTFYPCWFTVETPRGIMWKRHSHCTLSPLISNVPAATDRQFCISSVPPWTLEPTPFCSAPGPNAQWLIPSLDMQRYGTFQGCSVCEIREK